MRVLLLDGRNCVYRYGHVGRNLHNADGKDTGALHGLLLGMLALKKRFSDAKFVVVWDGHDTVHSWRGKIFANYKSNRGRNVTAETAALRVSVGDQIKVAKQLFDAIGVSQIEVAQLEADDVIGILSEKCAAHSWPVTVYSNDQDYLQLMVFGVDIVRSASEPKVTERDVKAKWHCGIADLLKLRAILGDVSDGIPRAVSGVGPVAAAHYIQYGVDSSLPSFGLMPRHVREHAQRLESYWPTIHMNYRLMRILRSCNDPEMPEDMATPVMVETRRVLKELARPAARESASYEGMIQIFAEMDLAVAIENRREIWQLQSA